MDDEMGKRMGNEGIMVEGDGGRHAVIGGRERENDGE